VIGDYTGQTPPP